MTGPSPFNWKVPAGRALEAALNRALALDEDTRARLLDRLESAGRPEDMNLPGFGFHGLTGFNPKRYAVSVSGNWRIMFAFDGEDAVDVDLEDYH